jgi:hypothetical protein
MAGMLKKLAVFMVAPYLTLVLSQRERGEMRVLC